MTHLAQLDWPGNIRQLENTVYRAVVMSESDQLACRISRKRSATRSRSRTRRLRPASRWSSHHRRRLPWYRVAIHRSPRSPQPAALPMLSADGEVRPLDTQEHGKKMRSSASRSRIIAVRCPRSRAGSRFSWPLALYRQLDGPPPLSRRKSTREEHLPVGTMWLHPDGKYSVANQRLSPLAEPCWPLRDGDKTKGG